MSEECFVKITNKDIYKKLCDIGDNQTKQTRKIAICFWISSTALTISLILMGVLLRL